MRLYKLIGLEIEALMAEHEETLKNIARYEEILNNYDAMAQVIMEDLDAHQESVRKKTPHRDRKQRKRRYLKKRKWKRRKSVFLMDRFGYAKTRG